MQRPAISYLWSSSNNSTYSAGSVAESAPPNYTDLLYRISSECLKLVGKAGREIPAQWDMPSLLSTFFIGDEDVKVIHPFLTDTYYDLLLHGSNSWVFLDLIFAILLIWSTMPRPLYEGLDWVADRPADVERKGRLPLFLNCVTKATYSGWIGLTRA
jgi:hypothetical protein